MRIHSNLFSVLFGSTLLPSLVSASEFSCDNIVADGINYNLNPLGGAHAVYHVEEQDQYVVNTTYVLNICNNLNGAANRGTLKCGTSKNVCGFEYKNAVDGSGSETRAFPIVGHESKNPEITRLKKADPDREGLSLRLWGGQYIDDDKAKKDAGAEIEFQCDPTRSGLEGLETIEDPAVNTKDAGDNSNGDQLRSLQFKSFGPSDNNTYLLKLDWKTRYACDDYLSSRKGSSTSSHWGFFTWFIVILFLCIAAYLVFGSWLNYNRYGARGWDLLPHGDTIRDVPYIFQDWFRRVVNTLQGSGSRAGYSAV